MSTIDVHKLRRTSSPEINRRRIKFVGLRMRRGVFLELHAQETVSIGWYKVHLVLKNRADIMASERLEVFFNGGGEIHITDISENILTSARQAISRPGATLAHSVCGSIREISISLNTEKDPYEALFSMRIGKTTLTASIPANTPEFDLKFEII